MKDKSGNWINNIIDDLNNRKLLETELILNEVVNKINDLVLEINNYVSEIHYGLKLTNEKINLSISELNELENKLREYLLFVDEMKRSMDHTNEELNNVKNEMIDLKHSLEESTFKINNRYNILEQALNQNNKKIEGIISNIKSLSKTHEEVINSLNSTKRLLYIAISISLLNIILISVKSFGFF